MQMRNNSRFFFVLLAVCAATGLGNIWIYPYYSSKFSGLFFIPYLIALFVLGAPLLMLEFSIGQYFNKNIVDLFASIKKWFSSIGWFMVFNAFIVMSYYAVLLSWHIIYFFVSFGLQWRNDAEAYFFNNVLQVSDAFRGFTQFSLPVFIALIMAWLIVFFYIKNGYETIKKYFLVTAMMFTLLMSFFFFYSLTLDNSLLGIYYFSKLSFSNFLNLDLWISAFSLATISFGLSYGTMHAFARKSDKGFVMGNSAIVLIFKLLVSIAIGFILFGILGFLSAKQGIGIENLVFFEFGSEFTILAQALPFFYKPTILSMLFFIFLAIFFIFGASALGFSISSVLAEKLKTKQFNAAVTVAGTGFLFGLIFLIKPGFYIMDIMIHFTYYNILIAILLEVLAVGWFFDSSKISEHINLNSIFKIGALWRFSIRYVVPLIILLLLFVQLKSDLLNYKSYPWQYILVFGIGIVIVPLLIAYLMPQKILDRR